MADRKKLQAQFIQAQKMGPAQIDQILACHSLRHLKKNGGFLNVTSEPGHGTTFDIYLPRHAGEQDQAVEGIEKTALPPAKAETLRLAEALTATSICWSPM